MTVEWRHGRPVQFSSETAVDVLTLGDVLRACQKNDESLSEGSIVLVAQDVLTELAVLHHGGGIHGSLTPVAIVLSDQGRFDLTQARGVGGGLDHHLSSGPSVSAALYLAPEVVLFGTVSPAGDVFSLGVILWECLLGQHPFRYWDDESVEAVVGHICFDPPLLPAGLAGRTADRGVLALASTMLVKNPDERPGTQELLGTIRTREDAQLALPTGVSGELTHTVGAREDEQPPRCIDPGDTISPETAGQARPDTLLGWWPCCWYGNDGRPSGGPQSHGTGQDAPGKCP